MDGAPALGVIKPIENEPACYTAACHAHAPERRLLGVLDVAIGLRPMESSRRLTTLFMALTAGVGLVMMLAASAWVLRGSVHQPVRRLIATLDELRQGDYAVRHPPESISEFSRLGDALNASAQDLQRANAELVRWTNTLERRVEAKTEELRKAQDQMIQVERMASLGKLAAVVAHEINNPLASVVTYSKLLVRWLGGQRGQGGEAQENLEILEGIASEAARCGDIVSSMLLFARRQGSRMEPADLNGVAQWVLFLLKHKLDQRDEAYCPACAAGVLANAPGYF